MENEYSVVTANKFNLFLDEDEPADVLESLQEAKSKKKDEKTSNAKSGSAKTEKAKGNKVLTPAQDQKVNEIKPKTDDNIKDNKSGKARNEGDRENRRPQSARENVPPRRQQQQQQSGEQRPNGNWERRPQQGFGRQERRRGGGGFRGDRPQVSGDHEEGGNLQQRDRPPRDNNRGFGDREGSGFQHDRPPRDNRRFRGGRPPRRGGDRAGFGGEGRPHGQNEAENTDQVPTDNRPNTADGAVEEGGDAGRKPWPESSGEVQEGGFGDRRGGRVFRRGGGGFRGGRGRGGYGGGRGGFDRYGKREFDRHSGDDRSGVKAVDKRAGGGAHNWGKTDDEMAANSEETAAEKQEWSEDVPRRDWAAESERADEANKESENAGDDGEMAAVEDDKEMTYAEYKVLQEKERSANARAAFNVRKPNEGHEDASWKKMVQLKKEVDDGEAGEEEEQDEEEHDEADKHGKGGKKLDIHFTLPDRYHGDGERGPRRGGRGGYNGGNREGRGRGAPYRGGRGGGYGGRSGYYDDNRGGAPRRGGQAPKFDDNDFPALS